MESPWWHFQQNHFHEYELLEIRMVSLYSMHVSFRIGLITAYRCCMSNSPFG
ncbi:hypothetical protein Lalb_Chr19g0130891 [Lupinus albus]|uniref:Uncharacterized protein n=1 Tax=Lupinus albus TaxID=3870 RepID=A0A6A4NU57_LUPAL|nr:hypothetical protein Lalb_Chr19g0130891 [Lupinus albus]